MSEPRNSRFYDKKTDAERENENREAIFHFDDDSGSFPAATTVLIFPKACGYPQALGSAQNRRSSGQPPMGDRSLKDTGFPPVYA